MEAVEFKDIESVREASFSGLCKKVMKEIDEASQEGLFSCDIDLGPVGDKDVEIIVERLKAKKYFAYAKRGPSGIMVSWTKF